MGIFWQCWWGHWLLLWLPKEISFSQKNLVCVSFSQKNLVCNEWWNLVCDGFGFDLAFSFGLVCASLKQIVSLQRIVLEKTQEMQQADKCP